MFEAGTQRITMNRTLFDLTGRTALVTGSTRGLGLTFATALASHGATVVLNGTNADLVQQRVRELQSQGHRAAGFSFDATNEETLQSAIGRIKQEVGPIDILVNNAGLQRRGALHEIRREDWDAVLQLNLTAAWLTAKHVVRDMIERRQGKIINVCSLMSFAGRPGTGAYAASKGGLAMLTKAMTADWAQYNIQVNGIAPGYFITDMTRPLADDPQFDSWVKLRTPAKRWGKPEELGGLAVFFASAASDFVTGQIVCVDGGWTANL
jgi:gluconate 5-dehydrogenase